MQRIRALSAPVTPEAFERDTWAYVDFVVSHASVAAGPRGVAGYCFSGALAMRTAAAKPDAIAAAASFHGGRLFTAAPDSPHLLLPRIKAELYFGHAVEDRSMPQLKAWSGRYESEIYKGAHHGWTVPDNPPYNHAQAERAFEKLIALFARKLDHRGNANAT